MAYRIGLSNILTKLSLLLVLAAFPALLQAQLPGQTTIIHVRSSPPPTCSTTSGGIYWDSTQTKIGYCSATNTWSYAGNGGAGTGTVTQSGGTSGYLPKWGTVPNLINSALDDGISASNTLTYTSAGGFNASGGPVKAGGSAGLLMPCGTPAGATSGYIGLVPAASCSSTYGNYVLPPLPSSGGLVLSSGAASSHVSTLSWVSSSAASILSLGALTYNASGTTTFASAGSPIVGATVTVTHSTSTTFSPTGLVAWGSYMLEIIQDSTGGGTTFTLGTGGTCGTWIVGGDGGGAITLSATANAVDMLAFTYDGTNCIANFRNGFN